ACELHLAGCRPVGHGAERVGFLRPRGRAALRLLLVRRRRPKCGKPTLAMRCGALHRPGHDVHLRRRLQPDLPRCKGRREAYRYVRDADDQLGLMTHMLKLTRKLRRDDGGWALVTA